MPTSLWNFQYHLLALGSVISIVLSSCSLCQSLWVEVEVKKYEMTLKGVVHAQVLVCELTGDELCWSHFFFLISYRKILAPGEEEHLEFEEDDEEGGAGAGSPDSFPARVPGRGTSLAMPASQASLSFGY